MKVERQLLIPFGDQEPQYEITQMWPIGSKFLKLVTLPEGVYAFFAVPDIVSVNKDPHIFVIAGPNQVIQSDYEFVDIVSVFTEVDESRVPEGQDKADFQAVVVFPIFRKPLS